MDCFGVHTSHMPKAVIAFLLCCWAHARRFPVFAFSRLHVFLGPQVQSSRFRVYSFLRFPGGVPAARTQISCAQQLSPLMRVAGLRGKYAVIYSIREFLNVPDLQTLLVDDNAEVLEECFEWLDIHRQISLRTNDSGVTWRPFCKLIDHLSRLLQKCLKTGQEVIAWSHLVAGLFHKCRRFHHLSRQRACQVLALICQPIVIAVKPVSMIVN